MARENKTEYALLGMLSLQSMSAYEIKKIFDKSAREFWSESDGQIYPILAKLAKEQLVSFEEETTKGGRLKKIYHLTPAGEKKLLVWLKKAPDKTKIRNEFLLKLFFFGNQPIGDTIVAIEQAREKQRDQLSYLNNIIESLQEKKPGVDVKHERFFYLSADFGRAMTQAKIAWFDKVLAKFKEEVGN